MRILVTGGNGQLAQDIQRCWRGHDVVRVSREQVDICHSSAVDDLMRQVRPDCIINTAAFHFVDACEDQAEQAFQANAAAVLHLTRAAQAAGAILVQFSTDYVFDGAKQSPYIESDPAHPLSVYGVSRLAGEQLAQQYCERTYVVRTCGLYGIGGRTTRAGNFVETMLRLARAGKAIRVVDDQIVTPTSTRELAEKLAQLVPAAPFGLYHMTNTGQCSWYEFACEIFRLFGVSPELSPVSSADFGARARRPRYSVLDNCRLRAAGIAEFRPWKDALADYVAERRATELASPSASRS
ncbi:MAG: dTDP-4-dehydrorhamnose reductase [Terriglobales bacterium]